VRASLTEHQALWLDRQPHARPRSSRARCAASGNDDEWDGQAEFAVALGLLVEPLFELAEHGIASIGRDERAQRWQL
jgi:hypothetical protein